MRHFTYLLLLFLSFSNCYGQTFKQSPLQVVKTFKQSPLQVVDIYNCGAKSSYLIDINKDGRKEKLNFVYDIKENLIRAFVYLESKLIEVPFLNRPKVDSNSRYSFVVTEKVDKGFGFTEACGSDHYEFYSYSDGKFIVQTFEEP